MTRTMLHTLTGREPVTSAAVMPATDRLGRPLRDLRISVTDRCNFRCTYCMPREVFGPGFAFLPRAELLTFEESHALHACSLNRVSPSCA